MQQDTAIKIESAREAREGIVKICLRHVHSPDDADSKRLGAKFGTLVNNLRSALNYTMRSFVSNKLNSLIAADSGKVIDERGMDFPYAKEKGTFCIGQDEGRHEL